MDGNEGRDSIGKSLLLAVVERVMVVLVLFEFLIRNKLVLRLQLGLRLGVNAFGLNNVDFREEEKPSNKDVPKTMTAALTVHSPITNLVPE
mmetsp:Transcript_4873/g.10729  ORF Transcript_4873/g.10729 Transcript_4873/m.10729 type:complete len:91 (-) Transcript_4873:17-289(-)